MAGWAGRTKRSLRTDTSHPFFAALVPDPIDSSGYRAQRFVVLEDVRFANLCAEPLLGRNHFRNLGRISRRDRLDWFRLPKTEAAIGSAAGRCSPRLVLGLWHAPVIDFLGAASPHGKALLVFFAAFVAAMAAMRVLIARVYERTQSVVLAQLLHIVSTGSLVVFSPPAVTPSQEAIWYAAYAAALWILALILTISFPRSVSRRLNTQN